MKNLLKKIKIRNNSEVFFDLETINFLAETLKKKLKSFSGKVTENLVLTRQSGANCYFVAAIELLLSSTSFLRFLEFYKTLQKRSDDSLTFGNIEYTLCENLKINPPKKFLSLLCDYIESKNGKGNIDSIYREMEKVLFEESQFPSGEQDDLNVVLLYLQRSFMFNLLFAYREKSNIKDCSNLYTFGTSLKYIEANKFEANVFEANKFEANKFEANVFETNKFEANLLPPFTIFVLIENKNKINVKDTLNLLNKTNTIAVSTKYGNASGGHYDVFQHRYSNNEMKFIYKNTFSPEALWNYIYIFCVKEDMKNIINLF